MPLKYRTSLNGLLFVYPDCSRFHEEGLEGLKKIKGIGSSLGKQIIDHLN
jgi:hypothetical protein